VNHVAACARIALPIAEAAAAGIAVARSRSSAGAVVLLLCVVLLGGCASIGRKQLDHAAALAAVAQPNALDCDRADACAQLSPLRALGDRALAESSANKPVNYIEIVEGGQDALLGRINLIRSARRSIDIQTFILAGDDSGYLFINELVAAARRGVKVRLLVDQLNAPGDPDLLANLASVHANFEMRLYNPTFGRARTSALQFAAGVACCFRRINQRMHNKLLAVDGVVAFTGGRNIADDYFDWNPGYDFRDRDVILAGPEVRKMERVFEAFWSSERSVPLARLKDVARDLLSNQGPPRLRTPLEQEHRTPRVLAMADAASDQAEVARRLVADARAVANVQFISDGPRKQTLPAGDNPGRSTNGLRELIEGARTSVLLQTPYLVLSKDARQMFRSMHERAEPPKVTISTNSLASTDAIPVYALSYKYKRRYLRELGFGIFELKPHPLDVPVDLDATGAGEQALPTPPDAEVDGVFGSVPGRPRLRSEAARFPGLGSTSGGKLAPLSTHGVRVGLHAKSIVIDGSIGIIGSHNFDPRSDRYNTESVLVFRDEALAQRLQAAILRDTSPVNSWLIAKRSRSAVSRFDGRMTELFENMPLFDLWPFRYATSYALNEGCDPVPPEDPRFHDCWTSVGDFPEVEISFKAFATRVLTAFGAGLAPIL
jgi:phosphatidylserine/phosphatidylglycerophosphate/cardiolipin synthase-like enzyme